MSFLLILPGLTCLAESGGSGVTQPLVPLCFCLVGGFECQSAEDEGFEKRSSLQALSSVMRSLPSLMQPSPPTFIPKAALATRLPAQRGALLLHRGLEKLRSHGPSRSGRSGEGSRSPPKTAWYGQPQLLGPSGLSIGRLTCLLIVLGEVGVPHCT